MAATFCLASRSLFCGQNLLPHALHLTARHDEEMDKYPIAARPPVLQQPLMIVAHEPAHDRVDFMPHLHASRVNATPDPAIDGTRLGPDIRCPSAALSLPSAIRSVPCRYCLRAPCIGCLPRAARDAGRQGQGIALGGGPGTTGWNGVSRAARHLSYCGLRDKGPLRIICALDRCGTDLPAPSTSTWTGHRPLQPGLPPYFPAHRDGLLAALRSK